MRVLLQVEYVDWEGSILFPHFVHIHTYMLYQQIRRICLIATNCFFQATGQQSQSGANKSPNVNSVDAPILEILDDNSSGPNLGRVCASNPLLIAVVHGLWPWHCFLLLQVLISGPLLYLRQLPLCLSLISHPRICTLVIWPIMHNCYSHDLNHLRAPYLPTQSTLPHHLSLFSLLLPLPLVTSVAAWVTRHLTVPGTFQAWAISRWCPWTQTPSCLWTRLLLCLWVQIRPCLPPLTRWCCLITMHRCQLIVSTLAWPSLANPCTGRWPDP